MPSVDTPRIIQVPNRTHITCVIGTRPEAIKMAPVIKALRNTDWAKCSVVATAQHRGLLDQTLAQFGIVPDMDLDLMTEGQSMVDLTSRLLPSLAAAVDQSGARAVLAQGDTASVFAAALVAFYAQIPFGHVEAGLRTNDLGQPFPEEGFRQMVARLSRWHFAPTESAAANLRREGIAERSIHVTGNTGIDSLMEVAANGRAPTAASDGKGSRLILLTAHRRESFGRPMAAVFSAVRQIADKYPDVHVLYPVHPNPNVKSMARDMLGDHPRIVLREPMDYLEFVQAMADSYLILTDSGGIQEEAPALGKPVLVLREQTERPEAIDFGVAKLVGTDGGRIFKEVARLLDDPARYSEMAVGRSPYGDGLAAPRIEKILRHSLVG